MIDRTLQALSNPARLRIVELLDESPRAVGEIAANLGLRQPQVTKHLRMLQDAGLITMHPLGQRRLYSLRRGTFLDISATLRRFGEAQPDDALLTAYAADVERESAAAARDPTWANGRTMRFRKMMPRPPEDVWPYWTSQRKIRTWWHPDHFHVTECTAQARPNGSLEIVLAEGDGRRYPARGRFLDLERPTRLAFELAPLGPDGQPLFSARYRLRLSATARGTSLDLRITVTNVVPAAAPALAGMRLGWSQLLHNLTEEVKREGTLG